MKKRSMRLRAVVLVSLFLLTTNLALGTVLARQARNATKTQINERMLDVVNTAAAMLDGDVLKTLRAEDKGSPAYQQVTDTLVCFRDNINLNYIYYVWEKEDGSFVFGIDTDPVAPAEFGSPVVYTDALYKASRGTPSVDEKPYEDVWGRFYSAFSPVLDSAGKVAGVVTADFDATWYETQINRSQWTILLAALLFLSIGIAITLALTGQYNRRITAIGENLRALAEDLDAMTKEYSENTGEKISSDMRTADIQALEEHISELRGKLRNYISHSTTQANEVRALAATRTDIQMDLERNSAEWIEAMLLAQNALESYKESAPHRWYIVTLYILPIVLITLLVSLAVIADRRKQTNALEQQCLVLRKCADIREELQWNDYSQFRAVCNERLSSIVTKLEQKGLSEREIRICVLVLIGLSYAQMADVLIRAESGIGKDKYMVAKRLGVSVKDLQTTLIQIARGTNA